MNHDEMIEVIKADKEGKPIQVRSRWLEPKTWHDRGKGEGNFDFSQFDYRVKPEPRKIYWVEYRSRIKEDAPWYLWSRFDKLADARACKNTLVTENGYTEGQNVRITEFVEVLNDLT